MRAVVCNEFGPLEGLVVEDRQVLEPGPGMVVIDVAAAGVNFVDGLICQGKYQLKPPTPFVPGSEVAGVISRVGPDVSDWSVGDRVLVFCGFGGFAGQVVAPGVSLVAVPDAIDLPQAAALIQSYCTMLFTLTRRTTVTPGEWVLVLGAGGSG
jgi:NADPH2:quinone reductase